MSIKKLINGSVLIENMGPKHIGIVNEKEIPKKLSEESLHGLIYFEKNGKEKNSHRIIHSQSGGRQEGVKSLPIERAISPQDRLLGDVFVLQPKQKMMNAQLIKVATKWDPALTYEQTEKLPRARGGVILPTPFEKREEEVNSKTYHPSHSLYRAFRAYLRNNQSYLEPYNKIPLNATPISKKKGICCSDFVAYSYKVALIDGLFPDGLPIEIEKAMIDIETFKKKEGVSKLDQIPEKLLMNFLEAVEKYIPKEDPNHRKLCIPIKGMGVEFFSTNAFARADDWSFEGYLCYLYLGEDKSGEALYEPYVIDHDLYTKLSVNENAKNGIHSICVTPEELDKLEKIQVVSQLT